MKGKYKALIEAGKWSNYLFKEMPDEYDERLDLLEDLRLEYDRIVCSIFSSTSGYSWRNQNIRIAVRYSMDAMFEVCAIMLGAIPPIPAQLGKSNPVETPRSPRRGRPPGSADKKPRKLRTDKPGALLRKKPKVDVMQ